MVDTARLAELEAALEATVAERDGLAAALDAAHNELDELRQKNAQLQRQPEEGASEPAAEGEASGEHERLLRRLIDVFWNQQATDRRGEFFVPGAIIHSANTQYTIEQSIHEGYARNLFTAFPDIQHEIEILLVQGSYATMRYHGAGTLRSAYRGLEAHGQQLDYHGNVIFRLASGLIAEVWSVSSLADWIAEQQLCATRDKQTTPASSADLLSIVDGAEVAASTAPVVHSDGAQAESSDPCISVRHLWSKLAEWQCLPKYVEAGHSSTTNIEPETKQQCWQACSKGDQRFVLGILKQHPSLIHGTHAGRSLLHIAALCGHPGLVYQLLARGAYDFTGEVYLSCLRNRGIEDLLRVFGYGKNWMPARLKLLDSRLGRMLVLGYHARVGADSPIFQLPVDLFLHIVDYAAIHIPRQAETKKRAAVLSKAMHRGGHPLQVCKSGSSSGPLAGLSEYAPLSSIEERDLRSYLRK